MKIVVIGDGKIGFTLTQALVAEGHDLVVIDNQKEPLDKTETALDVQILEGNGASAQVQRAAGVPDANLLIAVTNADETNILCCVIARQLGCPNTIARVRSPEYSEDVYLLKEGMGLNMAVNPERSTAKQIFGLMQYPSFLKRDSFAKGRAEIVEFSVREGSKLDGLPLMDLYKALKVRVLVCAVERAGQVTIPDGQFRLKAGDHVYVTAAMHDLLNMVKSIGLETPKVRSVMIIGGGRLSVYLGQMLISGGIDVKIIESSLERCHQLSALLPKAEIIYGDGTSFSLLRQEGIEEMDAIVCLTNLDEQNIIIAMYASRIEVPKVICKINRTEYTSLLSDKVVEGVIAPRILVSNAILRYVRALENRPGEGVITLHRLVDDRVEALEFAVTNATWYTDMPLKNIPLKDNLRIALITRRGVIIVPTGDDYLSVGDTAVIVTAQSSRFAVLNDIFREAPRGGRL